MPVAKFMCYKKMLSIMNKERQLEKADFSLDLRGVACPLNFVKTKIQLEKMDIGQVLEIWIDLGEAIESVPPSVIEEGHQVLLQEQVENYFKVLISVS